MVFFQQSCVGKTQALVRLPRQAQGRRGPLERKYWPRGAPGSYFLSMTLRGVNILIYNHWLPYALFPLRRGSVYNCASPLGCSAWLDQILLSLKNHVRSTDDLSKRWKSNRWKLRVEVTCKGRSVYEEKLKSIELSRAWSFYLSSSSSLSGAIRSSGLLRNSTSKHLPQSSNCLPQPQPQFPTAYWPRHLHHPDAFVPSWYASWFQTCTCRGLFIWSSQV